MKLDPLEIELGAKIFYYIAKTFLSIWQCFHESISQQHIPSNKRKKKRNKKHRKRKHHS